MDEQATSSGPVRVVTLSPELSGALRLIGLLTARGVGVRSATPTPPSTRSPRPWRRAHRA